MNLRAVQSLPREALQGANGGRAQSIALDRAALIRALSALTQAFRNPSDEKLLTGQTPPPHGFTLRLELFLIPLFLNECSLADIRKTLIDSVTEVLQAAHPSRLGSIADMRVSTRNANAFMVLREARQ